MSMAIVPKLFQPIKIGDLTLSHRVVLAPLTRFRANKVHVHGDLAVKYYVQRASAPGTLLISESTVISAKAGGYYHVPGIWNEEQVVSWKRVTDAVHAKDCRIFCQLLAQGRTADPHVLGPYNDNDDTTPFFAPSDIPIGDSPNRPIPLSISDIREYVEWHRSAAINAMRAGFDGIELHGANGYLIDQFLQDVSNQRNDKYGGSMENRCRFVLEVIGSIVEAIGAKKVALRLSPWNDSQGMRMQNPKPTFTHLVSRIAELYPDLAYLHVIEPRVNMNSDRESMPDESNNFLREIWAPRSFISNGGFTREDAFGRAEKTGDLIAFGRAFIANPDLPLRLAKNLPLAKGDRETYYGPVESPIGYVDYPFAEDPV